MATGDAYEPIGPFDRWIVAENGNLVGAYFGRLDKELRFDASTGSSLIHTIAAGTGAVDRTVQGVLREDVTVTAYGATTDGVDSTAAITTLFTNLGAAFTGTIRIPYGVKYTFNTVAPLAPVRAMILDQSAINGWDTTGSRQKITGIWEAGDSTAVTDQHWMVSSGHNAAMWLENRGTAGSSSASDRIVSMGWSSGRFKQGQPGIRTISKAQWVVSQFRPTLWHWNLRKYATWAARDYEIWAVGRVFAAGSYTIIGGKTYTTAAGGTCGSTQPVHTAGTVNDGGVDWTYVETSQDSFIFGVDEHGRLSTNATTVGYTYHFKQNTYDTENSVFSVEGTGASKTVTLQLNSTDSSGVVQSVPLLRAGTLGQLSLYNGAGSTILWQADADSFDVAVMGRREVVAADGDTAPSVVSAGVLVLSNTAPTSITALTNGASTQEVVLTFTTANTTLVNSVSFKLKGAVDVTPAVGGILVMKKFTFSSAWFEMSRNF